MNPVVVRDVKLGEGMPKICVPIVGTTKEEIIEQAKEVKMSHPDLIEWRGDWFKHIFCFDEVRTVLEELRIIFDSIPVLFTFRTANEGGEKSIETEEYQLLINQVVETGYVDLVDVELFFVEEMLADICTFAHEYGVYVIASNHDFQETPEKTEIVRRLQRMQELGADVLKIAVMPQCERDVLTLLDATQEMVKEYATKPVVSMSMSGLGVISRLSGETFGSVMTFGTVGKASAPGQIPVKELRKVLEMIHEK